jgi:sucrose-phosphate synthase
MGFEDLGRENPAEMARASHARGIIEGVGHFRRVLASQVLEAHAG